MTRKKKRSGQKRKSRPLSSLSRKPGRRQPRERVLIVCEGEKTEPLYFRALRRHLRLSSVEVTIEGKECYSAPIHVVNHAIKRGRGRDDFDKVWCVMDIENPAHNTSLHEAIDKAERTKYVRLALSNPAF